MIKKSAKSKTASKKPQAKLSSRPTRRKAPVKKAAKRVAAPVQPLRFAHPFFTTMTPAASRTPQCPGGASNSSITSKASSSRFQRRRARLSLRLPISSASKAHQLTSRKRGSISFHTVPETPAGGKLSARRGGRSDGQGFQHFATGIVACLLLSPWRRDLRSEQGSELSH